MPGRARGYFSLFLSRFRFLPLSNDRANYWNLTINEKILISACLLGDRVRYDGKSKLLDDARIERWQTEGRFLKHCPEVAGGLSTPRPAAEILVADGKQVLSGHSSVQTSEGTDLSAEFIKGARSTLALIQEHGIKLALLKSNSPSCGNEHVYNGRFNGTLTQGVGVTTALLRQNSVQVFNEFQLDEVEQTLRALENSVQNN